MDQDGNVWLAGNNKEDHQILKFAPDGKFLLQIGKPGTSEGSNSQTQLGQPAHMVVDEAANELYVADGYLNRRIIVFDARTGAYKRHWGAYGTKTPIDDKLPAYSPTAPLSQSFGNPVHCVRLSNDGLVYVCDRVNDRIQVFRKDGTFVKEFRVEPQTLRQRLGLGPGAVERSAAAIHLHGRRRQRPDQRVGARGRQGAVAVGPPRPPARPVQMGAQHRHQFEGQSLYRRGRLRPPGAEIPADRAGSAVSGIPRALPGTRGCSDHR